MAGARGFEPPPYPYDRLDVLRKEAEKVPGGYKFTGRKSHMTKPKKS